MNNKNNNNNNNNNNNPWVVYNTPPNSAGVGVSAGAFPAQTWTVQVPPGTGISGVVGVGGSGGSGYTLYGYSMMDERLSRIEARLAILGSPDEEKLKNFKALRNAYENYKLIEKLCEENIDSSKD